MRIRVHVVPPSLMPHDLEVAGWPTPDGLAIYLADDLPRSQRGPCIDAVAEAFLRGREAGGA